MYRVAVSDGFPISADLNIIMIDEIYIELYGQLPSPQHDKINENECMWLTGLWLGGGFEDESVEEPEIIDKLKEIERKMNYANDENFFAVFLKKLGLFHTKQISRN